MTRISRTLGLVGLAARQLASDRARTLFAVVGVAFAVLAVTLLFGVGFGVVETGEQLLDESQQDLWVTGGPIEFQPGTVGGFQAPVTDAHATAEAIESHDGVDAAIPLSLQTVYVSPDGEDFDTVVGTGTPGGGPLLDLADGEGFSPGGDSHYVNGSYDGPMSREVIVDRATATRYDLAVGDTLFVGGTISGAEQNEFAVVGISPTFRRMVGTRTVTLRLSELQTLTGTAHGDRATLITVRLEDGADVRAVRADLAESHPEFDVRTNREQFTAILERQSLVIAGGLSLVALAIIAGMVLSLNLFLSLIYQQRDEFAVFRALGGARTSTVGIAVVQSALIATAGAALGLALTPPLALGLDTVAATVTGFEGLVRVPTLGYLLGAGVAVVFGLLGTIASVIRLSGERPVARLVQ